MEEKFKAGLANQAMTEFENIKKLREEFIASKAEHEHVGILEEVMMNLLGIYMDLTK